MTKLVDIAAAGEDRIVDGGAVVAAVFAGIVRLDVAWVETDTQVPGIVVVEDTVDGFVDDRDGQLDCSLLASLDSEVVLALAGDVGNSCDSACRQDSRTQRKGR